MLVVRRVLIWTIFIFPVSTNPVNAFLFFNFHCGDDKEKVTRQAASEYFQSMSEIFKGFSQLEQRNTKLAVEQFSLGAKHLSDARAKFEGITKSSCFRPDFELNYKPITESDLKFMVLIFEYFKLNPNPEDMVSAESLGFSSHIKNIKVPKTLGTVVAGMLDASNQVLEELGKYQRKGLPQITKEGEPALRSALLLTQFGALVSRMTAEKT